MRNGLFSSVILICSLLGGSSVTIAQISMNGRVVSDQEIQDLKAQYQRPDTIPFPDATPYSLQLATLGKMLFFDPRLSGPQNMSCVACHNPSFGWEVPVDRAVGASNVKLPRQAPTILNAAWGKHFFWDGRADTLEHQAIGPITAAAEMNNTFDVIVPRVRALAGYRTWFAQIFPDSGVTQDTILRAIATYERTVVSGTTPFDRWVEGDEAALPQAAKRGFILFNTKAHCALCHQGWNFTDQDFHDIGLDTTDLGRAGVLGADAPETARYAFKTPGLREVAARAPYMHNGALADLEAVIWHYASGGVQRPSLSPQIKPLALSDQEVADLVAFLESLSADETYIPAPILPAD